MYDTTTSAMTRWIMALPYVDIRRAEAIRPRAYFPDGRPLRGVYVTPELCLGRDRKWYRVAGATIHQITTPAALSHFTLPQLQFLFYIAHRRQRRSHSQSTLAYR